MSAKPCGCDSEHRPPHRCDQHRLERTEIIDRLRTSLQAAAREASRAHDRIGELILQLGDQERRNRYLTAQVARLEQELLGRVVVHPALHIDQSSIGQEVI